MSKKLMALSLLCVLLAGLLAGCGATTAPTTAPAAEATQAPAAEGVHLRLATTTSTEDSGLLDVILPDFEKQCNCTVDVVAVGTGQAIEIGSKGDADVLLVHSRKAEDKFVADGHAKERFDVMYNDFILVGPTEDPAKVAGMTSSVDALKAIAAAQATFASRGDKSGTNTKELSLWSSAAITPTAELPWYKSIGQGMGDTLLFANEQKAYTLADRGTYLSMRDKLPGLTIVVGGETLTDNVDKKLLNPYGVMAVNADTHPGVNDDLAMQFVNWIMSADTQAKIGAYGVDKFGQSLFYAGKPPETAPAAPAAASAGFKITGKVGQEMSWTEAEIRAMPTIEAQATNKQGETSTYTGVPIKELLTLAAPAADATTLVMVGDDGYTAEVPLADVLACDDCIISFREQGGFSTVMPGMSGKLSVKGVIELQVK